MDETTEIIDDGMTLTLEQELIADLEDELSVSDELFNEKLMLSKIRSAMREVKRARNYPDTYTDETIEKDMYNYYSNIRNLALYDYSMVGMEYEQSHNESGVNRSYVDRNKMLAGVTPLAKII
jgi:CRISPR/Cas system-associated endonuclease Cas3-HD